MSVLAPGAVVGGCRIEGVVGKGGMGVVYLARQLELERDVALKVISPDLTEDALARGRFLAEARAAAAVEHPNVVPVHAVGTEGDRAYLVMRFIRGDDLRTLVRRDGPLPPVRAAAIAERLGDALDAIHRAGYVHRDVKPPNVLIDDDEHVYLSDFGLAKAALATRGPTSEDHWVGTLDYVAPEQIRGEPVDARTDVYALGGVLFFMLTGKPPFAHDADEAKLWAHLHEQPSLPTELAAVPSGFDAVVARALAKDPVDRQPSAGELGRGALAAARGEDVAAPTVTARRPPSRARRRAGVPWAWILGLMFAAAGGALLALAFAGDGGSPETAATPTPTPTPAEVSSAGHTRNKQPFKVVEEFDDVGFRPEGTVIAGRGAWIVSHDRPKVVWMDVLTRERKKLPAIGRGASSIATDGDKVWITLESTREVVRFDARTRRLEARFVVPGRPVHVAAGSAGLWIAMQEETREPAILHRFARDGTQSVDMIPVPAGVAALTAGGGSIWVALETRGRILRIGADGELEEHAFLFDATPRALAYGMGRLWAVIGNDSAARIHPRSEAVQLTDVDSRPADIELCAGYILITLHTADRVLVVRPRDWKQARRTWLGVEGNPMWMAAQGKRVFVTSGSDSRLAVLES